MKRFMTATAALALLALPPVLHATGTTATNPYVARYSLDYYMDDPVPLTAVEIRRIQKAAALYQRTGTITILQPRVTPQPSAPVTASTNCVPARAVSDAVLPEAPAPTAIVGPTAQELRRQAKADMLFKRTGLRTVLPAPGSKTAAPKVAAAAGVPCAELPVIAALLPNPTNPLTETIQSGSLLGTPGSIVTTEVPEPGTLGLLGLGLLGLGFSRRKAATISR